MIVITVARKPLIGSVAKNVLAHGTGGLNIEGCRIAGPPWKWGTQTDITGGGYGTKRPADGDVFARDVESNPSGRWPANLILQHKPECHLAGVKTVKGNTLQYKEEGKGIVGVAGIYGGFTSGPPRGEPLGHAGADGKESVDDWHCQPGCPVAALDEQSGVSISTGGRTANISTTSTIYGGGKGLGQDLDAESVRGDPGFGDKGGASRYFKQIKPNC